MGNIGGDHATEEVWNRLAKIKDPPGSTRRAFDSDYFILLADYMLANYEQAVYKLGCTLLSCLCIFDG